MFAAHAVESLVSVGVAGMWHFKNALLHQYAELTADAVQVTIKRIERNKRKHVTSVHGLEAFGACSERF